MQFKAMWNGRQRFVFCRYNPDIDNNDIVVIHEWDGERNQNTGRAIRANIVYGFAGAEELAPGHCILALDSLVNIDSQGKEQEQASQHLKELRELVKRTKEMRDAQKAYFAGKSSDALMQAKIAEGYCDKALAYFIEKDKAPVGKQGGLF